MATRRFTPNSTQLRTLTTTRPGARELTHEEEMVVRMRHGLSEGPDARLPGRALTAETRARLALMEASLLAEMHDTGPLAASEEAQVQVDGDLKARILDKLSKL